MPKGFYVLIAAQFASGLADNALMILGIFFLQEQGYPAWWSPLLKFSFNLAYVLLASLVGPIADAFSKGHLMAWLNVLKMLGVIFLLLGVHPLLAFSVTGLAAAVYAPAKYGLVTEVVPASGLVKANGWLEGSVVMSVILGVALGGALTAWHSVDLVWADRHGWSHWGLVGVSTQILGAFMVVLAVYAVSVLLNAGLPRQLTLNVRRPLSWRALQWSEFWQNHLQLWKDPLGGVSLFVTTLYWGVGAVLQFAVLAWAQTSLGLSMQRAAYLQALVAVGVILGAMMAARCFRIFNARKALPWGLLLAGMLPLLAVTENLAWAIPMLMLAGWAGGMLLVPMNAVLQHRGFKILSPGRSIAVQGFNENLSVLLMLAVYSFLVAWGVTLLTIMMGMACVLMVGMLPLCLQRHRRRAMPGL